MRKEDLIRSLAKAAGSGRGVGAGPDDGELRWGSESSKSLEYLQEVTSPEDEAERDGHLNFFRLENPHREDA